MNESDFATVSCLAPRNRGALNTTTLVVLIVRNSCVTSNRVREPGILREGALRGKMVTSALRDGLAIARGSADGHS